MKKVSGFLTTAIWTFSLEPISLRVLLDEIPPIERPSHYLPARHLATRQVPCNGNLFDPFHYVLSFNLLM